MSHVPFSPLCNLPTCLNIFSPRRRREEGRDTILSPSPGSGKIWLSLSLYLLIQSTRPSPQGSWEGHHPNKPSLRFYFLHFTCTFARTHLLAKSRLNSGWDIRALCPLPLNCISSSHGIWEGMGPNCYLFDQSLCHSSHLPDFNIIQPVSSYCY